jgi:hypothetical protein
VGWFKRDGGRRTGRHGYGVPDATARRLAGGGALTAVLDLPAVAADAVPPARLPDDRTMEQIGGKVADVLWSYYAPQGAPGTPVATTAAVAPAYDDNYDDAYDAAVFAPGSQVEPAPQAPVPPAARLPSTAAARPRFRVYERRRPAAQPIAEPVVPEPRVPAARRVVQLGFVDGSTLELPGDDPAVRALRSAAAALTLRRSVGRASA